MVRRFSINFSVYAVILDTFLVGLSLFIANAIRPSLNDLPRVYNLFRTVIPAPLYLILPLLWGLIFVLFSVYDGRKNVSFTNEFVNLLSGSFIAGIASAGVLYFSFRDISRLLYLTFFLINFIFQFGWRLLWRLFMTGRREVEGVRKVLIVGGNEIGREVAEKINSQPALGLSLAGYLDRENQPGFPARWLGKPEAVSEVVEQHKIDEVLLAFQAEAHQNVVGMILKLQLLPVKVWIIPEYFQLALFRAGLDEFAGIPMLDLRASALSDSQRAAKRVLDLLISIPVLVLGLPVMAAAALAILLETGRPVIFRQERIGENGKPFRIFKFRTMVQGAEEMLANGTDGPHKRLDDPRVTKVGRWLRRSSVDELPQFWNVVLGNMSLVGPRPELPAIVERYEPWQHQRFAVPPGITGWWQITGRSEKTMHLHTEEDIYYIKHFSIILDLQILARTIGVVIGGRGAF